jgi:hypothetical protein
LAYYTPQLASNAMRLTFERVDEVAVAWALCGMAAMTSVRTFHATGTRCRGSTTRPDFGAIWQQNIGGQLPSVDAG